MEPHDAADVTVRLPKHVGVRVMTDPGAAMFETHGLTQNDAVCTNAAYGVSNVTLQLSVRAGIGRINLEVAEKLIVRLEMNESEFAK